MRPQGRKDVLEVGIFAGRCPWRPDPICMTTVKVIERNGNILKVKGLDVVDGTPLIDIKPYTPPYDAVEGIRYPDWLRDFKFEKFQIVQTIFKNPDEIQYLEPVKEGFGRGLFVVIAAEVRK